MDHHHTATAAAANGDDPSAVAYTLLAKLHNVRPLVQLLKAISFRKQTQCVITHRGIKFSVEDARSVQAHAYLQRQFFQEFRFGRPVGRRDPTTTTAMLAATDGEQSDGLPMDEDFEMVFTLDLNVLIQCLTIFSTTSAGQNTTGSGGMGDLAPVGVSGGGGSGGGLGPGGAAGSRYKSYTSLGWVVNERGSEVEFVLEENEVISVCKLVTFEAEDMVDFQFQHHPIRHRLIIKSEVLRDALTELDSTSDKITFNFSPQAPHLRISTFGMSGSTEVNFSRDSDVIESFHAAATEHFSYRHSQVQHSLNALAFSTKTSIRINEMGSLSMQFMIQADRGDACFVELLCLPLVPIE